MGNPAGVRRDFGALERRRMEAAELLKRGVSQSEVARRLRVHRQSVIRWARYLAQSGKAGLKKAGRAGRKPRLSSTQLKQIEHALKRGPEALGYAAGLWTASRSSAFALRADVSKSAGTNAMVDETIRRFGVLERRRMEAVELLRRGVSQSEVARRLGVHRQSVIRWARQLAQSGKREYESESTGTVRTASTLLSRRGAP